MKLLVVVGAGGSFDSIPKPGVHNEANRPPLANYLFDNRPNSAAQLAKYPLKASHHRGIVGGCSRITGTVMWVSGPRLGRPGLTTKRSA